MSVGGLQNARRAGCGFMVDGNHLVFTTPKQSSQGVRWFGTRG